MTRHIPFFINAVVLVLLVTTITKTGLGHTDGFLTFAFDDAYTHMAVAKHLVEDGVYGLTRFEFSTPCSSLAWPLMIAVGFKLVGVREMVPLVLNVLCALLFLFRLDSALFRANAKHPVVRTFALAAVLFTVPLPVLCVFGMEHVLHMLGLLLLITEAAVYLSRDDDDPRLRLRVGLYAALAMSARFETLAAVAIVLVLCAVRKRYKSAAILGAISVSPAALFAIYSLAHGWPALPMSVLLKLKHSHIKDLSDVTDLLGGPELERMWFESHFGAVILGLLLLFVVLRTREKFFSERTLLVVLPLIVTLGHVRSNNANWFYRYEAYLVAIGVSAAVIVLFSFMRPRQELWKEIKGQPLGALVAFGLFAIVITPLWRRARFAFAQAPTGISNIYHQQIQMARFVKTYLPGQKIAINDIGAVAFYGDSPIVDLEGLGSREVARAKDYELFKRLTQAQMEELTKDTVFAAIYMEWYPNGVPTKWLDLGVWTTPNSIVTAFPSVQFWATNEASYPPLYKALREFQASTLPKDIDVHGFIYDVPPPSTAAEAIDIGDAVLIESEAHPDLSGVAVIPSNGLVSLGEFGTVRAAGRELTDLAREEGPLKLHFKVLEHVDTRRIRVVAPTHSKVRVGDETRQPEDCMMSRFLPQFNIGEHAKFHIWRHTEETPKRLDGPFAPDFRLENNDLVVVDAP